GVGRARAPSAGPRAAPGARPRPGAPPDPGRAPLPRRRPRPARPVGRRDRDHLQADPRRRGGPGRVQGRPGGPQDDARVPCEPGAHRLTSMRPTLAIASAGTGLIAAWLTVVLITVVPARNPRSIPAWLAVDAAAVALVVGSVAWLFKPRVVPLPIVTR